MSDPTSKSSPATKALYVLAAIATVVGTVIVVIQFFNKEGPTSGGTTMPPAPAPSISSPLPSNFSSVSSPSLTSSPTNPPPQLSSAAPAKVVTYLDQYWKECNLPFGSLQDTHDASIRGTVHTHALNQTPNGYEGTAFLLGEKADRFQASICVRDSSGPGHRIRFRVIADGDEIYDAVMRTGEKARRVDKSVSGVGTLIIAAYGDHGIGNATWGKAHVIGRAKLTCPQ